MIEIAAPRLNKTTKAFNRARKGVKYAKIRKEVNN